MCTVKYKIYLDLTLKMMELGDALCCALVDGFNNLLQRRFIILTTLGLFKMSPCLL